MTFPGLPIAERLALIALRSAMSHELQVFLRRYLDGGAAPEGWMIFEGNDFHVLKASMVFARAGEDVATIGLHTVPIRSGVPAGSPASDSEMDVVRTGLAVLWGAIKGYYPAETTLDRVVFHDAGPQVTDELGHLVGIEYDPQGHRVPGQGVANPALRTDIIGVPGTSAADRFLPPQVAVSVTLKTQFRRQWGRCYLPAGDTEMVAPGGTHVGGIGQLLPDKVDDIRDAWATLLDGLHDGEIPAVIWSTKHQHALSVDNVQVDSLFDVIRSRRYDRAIHYASHTVGS